MRRPSAYYLWHEGTLTPVPLTPVGLGLLGPQVLNDSGVVVGETSGQPAYSLDGAPAVTLGLPTGVTGGEATAINNRGDVIGLGPSGGPELWSGGGGAA